MLDDSDFLSQTAMIHETMSSGGLMQSRFSAPSYAVSPVLSRQPPQPIRIIVRPGQVTAEFPATTQNAVLLGIGVGVLGVLLVRATSPSTRQRKRTRSRR
jgi:hypothetical protein